ncbi:MAG TPA: hypothetical protein PLL64_08765 [Rhodothermales bacterium]|nr:hypothetical protein [Rhodothermales bacterium]HRR07725.1 hypothetical protein [Rhodothermales bacterium]
MIGFRAFPALVGSGLLLIFFFAGCTNDRLENLMLWGKTFRIMIPKDAVVAKDSFGDEVIIRSGTSFQLRLGPTQIDLPFLKSAIAANRMNRLTRILISSPEVLIYESQFQNRKEFHFLGNIKTSKGFISCKEDETPVAHSEAEIERMWAACKTLESL